MSVRPRDSRDRPSLCIIRNCSFKTRSRLKIEINIGLEFNQSEERKLVSGLVNFALIGQTPIQPQSQSLV